MKKVLSFTLSDFADVIKDKAGQGRKSLVMGRRVALAVASSLSIALKTSKGRDKICGVIQYLADFYATCIKHSNIPEIVELYHNNMILSASVSSKVKDSMSQARKIFRFLNFLAELKKLQDVLKKKKNPALKFLLVFSHIFSFCYYINDNILWAINIGLLSDIISDRDQMIWKNRKNTFSLYKVCINICKCFVFYILRKQKERLMFRILQNCRESIITIENDTFAICRAVLRQRQKRRIEFLELLQSMLRVILLIKSLKLTKYDLDRIFVCSCGLISSCISLLRILSVKSKTLQVKEEEELSHTEIESDKDKLPKKFLLKRRKCAK